MKLKHPCSGVILSGGLNTRMGGQNKAFLSVGNQQILDRLYGTLAGVFKELLLVSNAPLEYLSWDLTIVTDLFQIRSSLTGIHAGLFHASTSHVFVTACDMPFLKEGLIRMLLDVFEPGWDVIIPVTEKGYQPLCAIYSRRCIKPIEHQLGNQDPKIVNFFSKVRVKKVDEEQIKKVDPELVSFFNINRPEELATSDRMLDVLK